MKFMWQICEKTPQKTKLRRNCIFWVCSVLFATRLIFSACIPPGMKEPQAYNWYSDAVAVHFLQQSLQLFLHAPQPFSRAKVNWKAHVLTSADCKPIHHAATPISKHGWHLQFLQLKGKKKCSVEWFRKRLIHWYQKLENPRYLQLQHEPLPERKPERKPPMVAVL